MDAQRSTGKELGATPALLDVVYELLDAHQDTVRLGAQISTDPQWQAHMSYVRDLQRVGKETVARATTDPEEER